MGDDDDDDDDVYVNPKNPPGHTRYDVIDAQRDGKYPVTHRAPFTGRTVSVGLTPTAKEIIRKEREEREEK